MNMAQEYVAIKENNQNGIIAMSKRVFQSIAKIAIEEDDNLKIATKNGLFSDALSCKVVNDQLVLTVNVKIKNGANVHDTCAKVQGRIFENIEHMCGYQPDMIDIRVVGFIF